MTLSVHRLDPDLRPTLVAHFLSLPPMDRHLRFGTGLAPRVIAGYVERIDFSRDAVFGVHDDGLAMIGVAHIAFDGERAELGLSVLPEHRHRGVAEALFKRAIAHARNRGAPEVFMQFLSTNVPMRLIAQRFGMDIVSRGVEAYARLELVPASTLSIVGEAVTDAVALVERTLKALVAGWRNGLGEEARPL
jgi:GNAT superfamily N-acetyltransferase